MCPVVIVVALARLAELAGVAGVGVFDVAGTAWVAGVAGVDGVAVRTGVVTAVGVAVGVGVDRVVSVASINDARNVAATCDKTPRESGLCHFPAAGPTMSYIFRRSKVTHKYVVKAPSQLTVNVNRLRQNISRFFC